MGVIDVAIGIVRRRSTVLITRRPAGGSFAGCWEFPGGKREPGETIEQCLVRELWEELHLHVVPTAALAVVEHSYPTASVRLHPFLCRDADPSEPPVTLAGVAEARWVEPAQLVLFRFPPANGPVIESILAACAADSANG
jgi:mutator protein MutT